MSARIAALPSRELVRTLLCRWRHEFPLTRGQARALDKMRHELRRRERQPVAADKPKLGPVLCDPRSDPFCEPDGEATP